MWGRAPDALLSRGKSIGKAYPIRAPSADACACVSKSIGKGPRDFIEVTLVVPIFSISWSVFIKFPIRRKCSFNYQKMQ